MKLSISILSAVILFSGCASTQTIPMPSGDITPDKARIKVYRESRFVGGARTPALKDNGVMIGEIANGGTLIWDRPVGDSCLSAQTHKLCFKARGGKITEVTYSIRDGFMLNDFSATDTNQNVIQVQ